jgi:hypothetical protein
MSIPNLSPMIDAYGKLVAQIAELEKRKEQFQADFKALEAGTHAGEQYVLTIIDSTRETPDATYAKEIKAATEAFKASKSAQYLRAHVSQKPIRTHRTAFRAPVEEVGED